MNNTDTIIPLAQKVVDTIKKENVHQKPHWVFVCKALFLYAILFLIGIFAISIFSFVIFIIQKNGLLFMSAFGLKGVLPFLLSLPWIMIASLIIFWIILEIIVRHYSFGYRRPIVYSFVFLGFCIVLGGVVIYKTSIHDKFLTLAQGKDQGILKSLYKEYGLKKQKGVKTGSVIELFDKGLLIKDFDNNVFFVLITPETRLPEKGDIDIDDNILVIGEEESGMISAVGIKRMNDRLARALDMVEKKKKHIELKTNQK